MNLTSKRMLQFAMLCAGVCVLSATAATQFIADSFENEGETLPQYAATNGMPIVYYRATDNGAGVPMTTNWFAADGDASQIVDADVVNQAYAVSPRPMAGAASNLVLNLETEGQTLTRTVTGAPMNFVTGAPVYVDTLIKFTPSEDDPVIEDANVKAAVFVNVSSNLVVYHGVLGDVPTTTDTGIAIDPEQWYRLTILLSQLDTLAFFEVYLDGTLIETASGWTPGETPSQPGPWFPNASTDNTLNAIAFQGTGMVDELVVADEVTLSFGTTVMLTLAFNDALMDVTQGATTLAPNDQVAVGSTISISAIDWYEIASVTGDGVVYTGTTGEQVKTSSGDLTMVTPAETNVTIVAQQYTGTIGTGLPAPYDTVSAVNLSAWAVANNKTEAEVVANAASWLDDYLLNVAPDTDATIEITSIVVDEVGETATITVGASTTDVHLDQLNGTLVVYTCDALGDGFAEPTGEYNVTVEGATESTVVVTFNGGKFIKAVVR